MIDPIYSTGNWLLDEFGNRVTGFAWSSTNEGQYILMSQGVNGLIAGYIGMWDDVRQHTHLHATLPNIEEAAANEDGTAIIVGGSTPGIGELRNGRLQP